MLKNVFMALLLSSGTGLAHTHPAEPTVNLGDTRFLYALGGPGVLLEQIGDAYHSGLSTNGKGQGLGTAPAVNSVSSLTHGIVLTKHHFLGAWYGTEVVVTAAHVMREHPALWVDSVT